MSFLTDLRVVVRAADFRRLYATRLTSQTADGMVTVGLTSFVFFSPERSATAADAAAAFATLLLPYSLVGPFAGVLLDRWRRRQILVGASVVRAVLVAGLAAMVSHGYAGVGFYLTGLAVLSVNRFFLSALSAALPHVVAPGRLVIANSVSTTSGTLAALLGGMGGFALRELTGGGTGGTTALLALAAALCLLAAAVATRMHPDLLGPDGLAADARAAVRHVVAGMVDGARHVRERAAAARALAAITGHRFCYGLSTISTILLYRNHFNDPADTDAALRGLAVTVAASGVGFLLAAVLTPEIVPGRLRADAYVVVTIGLAALAEAAFVLGPVTPVTVPAGALVLGFAAAGSKICVDAIVQAGVEDDYRGRVFSFYDVLFNASFVAAAVMAAAFVPADGFSRPLYAAIALGYALTAGAYGRRLSAPPGRALEATG